HTSYIHILDASTFQTDEFIRVPMTSQTPLPTSPLPHVPSPLPSNRHMHLSSLASSRASTSSSQEDENTGSDRGDYRYAMRGDVMDVDEEGDEREYTPSRSASPSPGAAGAARMGSFEGAFASAPSPEPISTILKEREMQRERERERESVRLTYPDDLDITGMCFDPSGGWVYAGTTCGVVEWGMRGTPLALLHPGIS
ncbi:hypothetical protein BDQ17DRAFT_1336040, partial [Cyathus striatus]